MRPRAALLRWLPFAALAGLCLLYGVAVMADSSPITAGTGAEALPGLRGTTLAGAPPGGLPGPLGPIDGGKWEVFSGQEAAPLAGCAARLGEAKRPVLLGGADLLGSAGVATLLKAAADLDKDERSCGAFVLLGGPDSFGGALLAEDGPGFDDLLTGMEEGAIRALVCLEADPLTDHPDRDRVVRAFLVAGRDFRAGGRPVAGELLVVGGRHLDRVCGGHSGVGIGRLLRLVGHFECLRSNALSGVGCCRPLDNVLIVRMVSVQARPQHRSGLLDICQHRSQGVIGIRRCGDLV